MIFRAIGLLESTCYLEEQYSQHTNPQAKLPLIQSVQHSGKLSIRPRNWEC